MDTEASTGATRSREGESASQPSHLWFFKASTEVYLATYKRDRKAAKEFEYIHCAGTWLQQGLDALELFQNETDPLGRLAGGKARMLALAVASLDGARELLATCHLATA